jgi:hypothetical protein
VRLTKSRDAEQLPESASHALPKRLRAPDLGPRRRKYGAAASRKPGRREPLLGGRRAAMLWIV